MICQMGTVRLGVALMALALAPAVLAADMSLGEFEYVNSCAACHGLGGKGDGPVTDFLSGAEPPDLTVLQSNNGGVFPVSAIYATIEGADGPSVHGSREMPVWGSRFHARATGDASMDVAFSQLEADSYVQARILALIEYLSSLQVN